MTGFFLADWAIFAVSLFNASLLLWLGLTVILNAERRTAGVWALGGSMLLGAAFFISHTAILDYELTPTTFSLEFWWRAGWMPVIASPFAWYAMMLWYAGYWSAPGDRLRRRQRPWFVASAALGLLLLLLIAFAGGLPSFIALTQLDMTAALTVGGLPILFALYPVFMLMCIVLSVDALLRPAPSERLMGDLARARTRPWLLGATLALLFVALLVSWFIGGAISTALAPFPHYNYPVVMQHVAWYDLAIESLIGLAILLIGQAIVSYEVFTGKTLPRRGFSRLWRSALMLSLGYAVLVGGSLVWGARLFYSLLRTTLLMVAFLAMNGWRSFVERDRFMAQLRPFVSSDHRLDRFLDSDSPDSARAGSLFAVLCRDVLDVGQGQLAALGGTWAAPRSWWAIRWSIRWTPPPSPCRRISPPGRATWRGSTLARCAGRCRCTAHTARSAHCCSARSRTARSSPRRRSRSRRPARSGSSTCWRARRSAAACWRCNGGGWPRRRCSTTARAASCTT
ncbi:MAG: hypothetical protein P8Z40_09610 [Chloroflexota bacterium]